MCVRLCCCAQGIIHKNAEGAREGVGNEVSWAAFAIEHRCNIHVIFH